MASSSSSSSSLSPPPPLLRPQFGFQFVDETEESDNNDRSRRSNYILHRSASSSSRTHPQLRDLNQFFNRTEEIDNNGRGCGSYSYISHPMPSSSSRRHPQLKDLNKFFSDFAQNGNNNNNTDKKSKNEIQECSKTIAQPAVKSDTHISVLPVEMLLKIFSHLDEPNLLEVSKVSTQWKEILNAQQELWEKFTKKRCPLLERKTETSSWLKMYTALDASCCCRICANEMMQKSDHSMVSVTMRRRAERDNLARFDVNGIRAVPLDGEMVRWQASIVGPPDSPYEGGTFYLYIYMPINYPFEPPTTKFLTKIIHPNVSRHGDIGLDIITWNYCLSLTVNPMLLSIQSLLCDPFTKVCMEPELGRLYDQDRQRFDALARHWTKKYAMMNEITFEN